MKKGKKPILPPPPAPRHCGFLKRSLFKNIKPFLACVKNNKGLGLAETILAMSFLLITSYGVFRVSEVAGKNAKLVHSELDKKDLRMAVFKGLGNNDSCFHNLRKTGGNSLKDSIVFLETPPPNSMRIIEKDQLFKPSLRIKGLDIDKNNKKFSVYYTKEGLGKYETLLKSDGTKGICEPASSQADNKAGCYSLSCKIDFHCGSDPCQSEGDKCSLTDCAGEGIVVAGGGANCYQVDSDTATGGKTLVGCGGTDQAGGTKTTALGFSAGKVNTGKDNTFLGAHAGEANTGNINNLLGSQNTFLGSYAGSKNTTGRDNTFVGTGAGWKNTSHNNTFLGAFAGNENTTARDNTFIGRTAGWKNTTGSFNTFIGRSAGQRNTTPGGNTFIGEKAGLNNTIGRRNTFIGAGAGQGAGPGGLENIEGHNNIAIGGHVYLESSTGSHQINIGKIIKAGSGFLKICDSTGSNCLKIKGPTFSCPDGQVLKGIKTDGTPECVRGCTPQTGFFFGKQKRSVTTARVTPPAIDQTTPPPIVSRAQVVLFTA